MVVSDIIPIFQLLINKVFDIEREGLKAELKLLGFPLFLGMSCFALSPKIISVHQQTFYLNIKSISLKQRSWNTPP